MTEVYFENIESIVASHLSKAQHNIYVAVAWFTNERFLECLKKALDNNVKVRLVILDDILNRCEFGLDFGCLISKGADLRLYSATNKIMHNKFCIVDNIVITGSYNWTYFANKNKENIVIIDKPEVVDRYVWQFEDISEASQIIELPYEKVCWENVKQGDFTAFWRHIYNDVSANSQIPQSWMDLRKVKLKGLNKAILDNDTKRISEASRLPIKERQTSLMEALIKSPSKYELSLWEEEYDPEINKVKNTAYYCNYSERLGQHLGEFLLCYLHKNNGLVEGILRYYKSESNITFISGRSIKIKDSDFVKTMESYSNWKQTENGAEVMWVDKSDKELRIIKYVGFYFFQFDKPLWREGRKVYGLYVMGISKTNDNGKDDFYEGWNPKERFDKIKNSFFNNSSQEMR